MSDLARSSRQSAGLLTHTVRCQGTTGPPKGVMLTHYNMVVGSFQNRKLDVKGMSWDVDAQIGVLPFFHIYVRIPAHSPLCSSLRAPSVLGFVAEHRGRVSPWF